MKNNIKLTITGILLTLFSLAIISCRQSDDHITDPGNGTGQTEVRINLKGSDFTDEGSLGSQAVTKGINEISKAVVQTEEITFSNNDDYKLVATLTPESSINPLGKASILEINPLPNDIRYNVAVFDASGNYVTEQIYFTGREASMPAITGLNGGSTYTFVVYSVGTTTGLPAINFTDPNNKTLTTATLNDVSRNVDLMYFSKTLKISGNNTNYLDVILQHKYSLITTTIDSTPTKYYTIGSITNATITPHYSSATLNLSNGSVTRANTSSRVVGFSGSGTTLTANPIFFNTEATSNGIFKIETVVLQKNNGFQVTHQNVSFNNLKITPGVKYNLKLSFVPNDRYIANFRGYPAVSINGVIFMRHNLGANTSSNPDIPSVNIAGNYYQWGRKNPVATAATGTGAIPGWNTTVAPQGAWNSGTRTAPIKNTLNDPCPTGWRVISRDELGTLVDNTTHSYTGNAATTNIGSAAAVLTSKFNTSVKVTLPFTGFREGTDGRFSHAATGGGTLIDGNYWSADNNPDIGRIFALFNTTESSFWVAGSGGVNTRATPIRCVAEYPY